MLCPFLFWDKLLILFDFIKTASSTSDIVYVVDSFDVKAYAFVISVYVAFNVDAAATADFLYT